MHTICALSLLQILDLSSVLDLISVVVARRQVSWTTDPRNLAEGLTCLCSPGSGHLLPLHLRLLFFTSLLDRYLHGPMPDNKSKTSEMVGNAREGDDRERGSYYDETGDIILVSSDNKVFRTHLYHLISAS